MLNNLMHILFVPEVTLSILTVACLMYGLFSKNNSFNKATNFATLSLLFTAILIYLTFLQTLPYLIVFFQTHNLQNFLKFSQR